MKINIRLVEHNDNEALCNIIRTVLESYGGKRPGTAYYDSDTENMYEAFQKERSIYYVAEVDGKIVGGCGIQPLAESKDNYAELQKLYLLPESRRLGIGKKLVQMCIDFATEQKYAAIYLETFGNMKEAQSLYRKHGFEYHNNQLGGTGHSSCDVWMLKRIDNCKLI